MTLDGFGKLARDIADLAGPVVVIVAISSTLMLWGYRKAGIAIEKHLVPVPIAFGLLGGIAGVISGSSTESLVGGLVTSVLGIVSALLSYLLTREADEPLKALVPPIIVLLLFNSLTGLAVGGQWRLKWDNYRQQLREHDKEYDEIWLPITKDIRSKIVEKCIAQSEGYDAAAARCRYEKLFPDD